MSTIAKTGLTAKSAVTLYLQQFVLFAAIDPRFLESDRKRVLDDHEWNWQHEVDLEQSAKPERVDV